MIDAQALDELLEKYERLFEEQLQRQETEFAERMKVIDNLFSPGSDPDPVSEKETLEEITGETIVEAVSEEIELRVVEIAIMKLEPTTSDMVIFWLPEHFTQADAHQAGLNLKNVIQNRFRFAVFVRNAVSVSVIKGSSNKILLPS